MKDFPSPTTLRVDIVSQPPVAHDRQTQFVRLWELWQKGKVVVSMKKLLLITLALSAFSVVSAAETIRLKAILKPLEENPTNVTDGSGTFWAVINDNNTITFKLSYKNLSTPVTQAHVHIGATKINGAIAIFFCGPSGSPAHQTCPNDGSNSGSVTDTVSASDVVINAQGISPGDFGKVLRAIVNHATYVNVHTTLLPGGEIRGQIRAFPGGGKGNHDWDDDDKK
jgi:CHRD domain-containing protein